MSPSFWLTLKKGQRGACAPTCAGPGKGRTSLCVIVLSLFVHLQEAVFMTRTSDHLVTGQQFYHCAKAFWLPLQLEEPRTMQSNSKQQQQQQSLLVPNKLG
jgi:hypothetical protein